MVFGACLLQKTAMLLTSGERDLKWRIWHPVEDMGKREHIFLTNHTHKVDLIPYMTNDSPLIWACLVICRGVLLWGWREILWGDQPIIYRPQTKFCEGYVFIRVCLSFCSRGVCIIPACIAGGIPGCLAGLQGGGGIPACLASLQAHTQGGVSRPTPREGVEGIPACTEADTPSRWLLLWAVCILLECILILTQHSEINVRFIDCKVLSLIYPAMNSSLLSQLCLIKVNHLFTLSYPHLFQIWCYQIIPNTCITLNNSLSNLLI